MLEFVIDEYVGETLAWSLYDADMLDVHTNNLNLALSLTDNNYANNATREVAGATEHFCMETYLTSALQQISKSRHGN